MCIDYMSCLNWLVPFWNLGGMWEQLEKMEKSFCLPIVLDLQNKISQLLKNYHLVKSLVGIIDPIVVIIWSLCEAGRVQLLCGTSRSVVNTEKQLTSISLFHAHMHAGLTEMGSHLCRVYKADVLC